MFCGRVGLFFSFSIFFIFNVSGQKAHFNPLVSTRENVNTGIIALLLQKHDDVDDNAYDVDSVEPPHDEKVYNLYHIMRMAQEHEDLDDDAAKQLEKTGDILRQALRRRCNKLDTCVSECPRKKKYNCTMTCKEVYDNRDVCNPKPPCQKQKCKTLPPSWL